MTGFIRFILLILAFTTSIVAIFAACHAADMADVATWLVLSMLCWVMYYSFKEGQRD